VGLRVESATPARSRVKRVGPDLIYIYMETYSTYIDVFWYIYARAHIRQSMTDLRQS